MANWYLARPAFVRIETAEVVSETEAFVTLANGRRDKKSTDYGEYLKDREEAKAFILRYLLAEKTAMFERIANIERKIEDANNL